MARLAFLLLSLLFFGPPSASLVSTPCPTGAESRGHAPPDGTGWECGFDVGGDWIQHGWSVDYWPNGHERTAAEYQRGYLHGRYSEWDELGQLRLRGTYDNDRRVGYWWFWTSFGSLLDPDGAVARRTAEQMLVDLGAQETDAPALAQHLLENAFLEQPDIRSAPQLCSADICISAAQVEGRGVLAVHFDPSSAKTEAIAPEITASSQRAAAAHKAIDQARRRRDEAFEKAKANYASRVRSWENTSLECRDGTRSPSCVCGGSSQGCCSHHGGVAGCPRSYPSMPTPDTGPLVPNEFARDQE